MWPGVLMCLCICFAAVGAAGLYEFEISESISAERPRLGTAALMVADFLRNLGLFSPQDSPIFSGRQAPYDYEGRGAHAAAAALTAGLPPLRSAAMSTQNGVATLRIDAFPEGADADIADVPNEDLDSSFPLPASELRGKSNLELIQHTLALEAELRASEQKYYNEQLGSLRVIFEKLQHNKETEFRQNFLPRATLTAGEFLLRLGKVEIPPHVASISIKLGIAMLVSGDLAGPNPMSPVADFLVFLMRRLPH